MESKAILIIIGLVIVLGQVLFNSEMYMRMESKVSDQVHIRNLNAIAREVQSLKLKHEGQRKADITVPAIDKAKP